MASRERYLVFTAAISLLIATALGAYASHGMQSDPERAVTAVRTAVSYQFYHAFGLLAAAVLSERLGARASLAAAVLFIAGTLLFCGGIYAAYLLGVSGASRIAPAGGMLFMAGWAAIAFGALRAPQVLTAPCHSGTTGSSSSHR